MHFKRAPKNSAFYENVIILLVEQKDRLQGRALLGEAAVEKLTAYSREYQEEIHC